MTAKEASQTNKYEFQAEVSQLLDILTHSLYSHRDVFIRELVSNAADALDKVRFMEVKGETIRDPDLDYKIQIKLDKDNKQLTISDTGIGMTQKELVENIGTIARSGTSEFVKQLKDNKDDNVNLIGRFGVGFYSVFMAGEKVEITTRSAKPDSSSFIWTSDGQGSFEIEDGPEDTKRGTTIKIFLREDAVEFAEEFRMKNAIETYSNFVPFPIYVGDEQVNKISAIWREPKSNIKDEQYKEFYKFIAKQSDDPATWLHFSADVPLQFNALLFIPKTNFEIMGFGKEEGIHLFVKRVLVDSHAKEVLPNYLRFVQGVVESDDLPLNISRETLQENPYLIKIKNSVVGKFLSHLQELGEKDPDAYQTLWKEHGRILKEGYNDYTHKDKIAELFRFNSSKCVDGNELVSLTTYVDRMHEKQSDILFLSGTNREALDNHPAMEIFKAKNIEVLYCYDPIDEFVLPGLFTFKDKKIVSADQVDMNQLKDIESVQTENSKKKKAVKTDEKAMDQLARRIKDILGNKVEDVKLSERLVDSPAVLVGSDKAMSSQMEKIMHMMNKDVPIAPKVMEINPSHAMIENMLAMYQKNAKDPMLTKMANGLLATIQLLDGSIDDPHAMVASMQEVLVEAAQLYSKEAGPERATAPKTKKTTATKKSTKTNK